MTGQTEGHEHLWGPKTVSPYVSWAYLDVAARPV